MVDQLPGFDVIRARRADGTACVRRREEVLIGSQCNGGSRSNRLYLEAPCCVGTSAARSAKRSLFVWLGIWRKHEKQVLLPGNR